MLAVVRLAYLSLLIAVWPAPLLRAQDGPVAETESADAIEPTIRLRDALERDPMRRSLLPDWYGDYSEWRRGLHRRLGLEGALTYDMVTQGYVSDASSFAAASGDLTLSGRWRALGRRLDDPLFLAFRLRYRDNLFGLEPASQVRPRANLLWGTVDGFSDSGFQIPDFYFKRNFFHDRLAVRVGQMTIDSVLDQHGLRSAKRFFLNQAFASNPSVAFPSFGAGFVARIEGSGRWDLTLGSSNVQGTRQDDEVDFNLESEALFSAFQLGLDLDGWGGQPARFQWLGWHSDAIAASGIPEGEGVSLTFEQEGIPEDGRVFARYGFSHGDVTRVEHLVVVGLGRERNSHDHWGIGFGVGKGARGDREWQGVAECYYRWQVTRELHVTPDLQVIAGDNERGRRPFQVVFGIRGGLSF